MYRAMGQDGPRVKRILELNPTHPLVTGLRAAVAAAEQEATAHEQRADDPALPETAELLYGMAVLAEGGDLSDPARFARLLADRLARSLSGDS
jgi:molecular chaperone HtpG